MKTNHTIEVECSPEKAFEACLNVDRWVDIFPPCLDSRILEETEESQTIFLTAKANERVFSWESTREIDRQGRSISFSQSVPSPLVHYMDGHWSIEPKKGRCLIMLSHEFEIKEDINGLVEGVGNKSEALAFMLRAIENNSTRELAALKKALECDLWRHEFSESLTIDHSKPAIYQLLSDVTHWPWLLPHCNNIEVLYDDHCYQEFVMEVQVNEKIERIRSVRILHPDRIEYFQPAPPPALKEHQGRWKLVETENGVEVESWHSVVLNPEFWACKDMNEAKEIVENAINANSLGTMKAIAGKLEGVKKSHA